MESNKLSHNDDEVARLMSKIRADLGSMIRLSGDLVEVRLRRALDLVRSFTVVALLAVLLCVQALSDGVRWTAAYFASDGRPDASSQLLGWSSLGMLALSMLMFVVVKWLIVKARQKQSRVFSLGDRLLAADTARQRWKRRDERSSQRKEQS